MRNATAPISNSLRQPSKTTPSFLATTPAIASSDSIPDLAGPEDELELDKDDEDERSGGDGDDDVFGDPPGDGDGDVMLAAPPPSAEELMAACDPVGLAGYVLCRFPTEPYASKPTVGRLTYYAEGMRLNIYYYYCGATGLGSAVRVSADDALRWLFTGPCAPSDTREQKAARREAHKARWAEFLGH